MGLDEQSVHSTKGWGASRTVAVLTGLSLAVNLLIAGAYLGSSYFVGRSGKPPIIDRRFAELAGKLGIDEGDPGLGAFRRALKIAIDVRRLRSQPIVDDILVEFGKPAPDTARIQALQEQAHAIRRAGSEEVLTALVAFLAQATPKERAEFIALLRDRKDEATTPLRYGLMP